MAESQIVLTCRWKVEAAQLLRVLSFSEAKAIKVERHKLAYARGFTLFERDRAYVLKPLARRHWTRTAALNDADAMFAAMLETAAGRA